MTPSICGTLRIAPIAALLGLSMSAQSLPTFPCAVAPIGGTAAPGALGPVGPGIVVDIDNDGDDDVVMGIGSSALGVARSVNGRPAFPATILGTGGATVLAVEAADLDADGDQDLVALSWSVVLCWLNDGTGSFGASIPRAITGFSASLLRVGRLDGDALPDLLVGAAGSTGGLGRFLNAGNGNFQAMVQLPSVGPWPFLLADLDRDGDDDLHVKNGYGAMLTYPNSGSGVFAASATTTPFAGFGDFEACDIDGDGDLDVVASASTPFVQGALQVATNDGTGALSLGAVQAVSPMSFTSFSVGDFDGDGDPDVVGVPDPSTPFYFVWSRNGGAANFQPSQWIPSLPDAFSRCVGDVGGDGIDDLVVFGGFQFVQLVDGSPSGLVIPGESPLAQGPGNPFAGTSALAALRLADLDADGRIDALAGSQNGTFAVVRNLATVPSVANYTLGAPIRDIVVDDWNADGKRDVVLCRGNPANDVGLLLGDGAGSFSAGSLHPLAGSVEQAAAGDFNGDQRTDVVALFNPLGGYAGDRVVVLLAGDGLGGFAPPVTIVSCTGGCSTVSGTIRSFAAGDLNRDGRLDLVLCRSGAVYIGPQVEVTLGNGNGTFGALSALPSTTTGPPVLADLNGDGILDLLLGGTDPTRRLGDGAGGFGAVWSFTPAFVGTYSGGLGNSTLAVLDFDADGATDVVFDRGALFRNDGLGNFTLERNHATAVSDRVFGTDLDNNPFQDFVTFDRDAGVLRLYRNRSPCAGSSVHFGVGCRGSGAFVPEVSISGCPTPGGVVTIAVRQALGGAPGFYMVGASPLSLPTGQGCTAYIDPALAVFVPVPMLGPAAVGAGRGAATFAIPASVPVGASATLQFLGLDPLAHLGIAASGGLTVTFR